VYSFSLKLFCSNSRTKTTQLKYFYIEKELSMAKKIITILLVVTMSLSLVVVAGCESDAQSGALIGAGVGAIAGQAIGGDTEGTLIGAGVGAAGGYIIGNEQDKKK
jgi:outer membrane lipoprotein SlyB